MGDGESTSFETSGGLYAGDLILENDAVSLWYHPQHRIVHHQMKAMPTSEQFRELLTQGAATLEQFGADKWLSDDRDNRDNTVVREPDSNWAESEWFRRVARSGFKYWGIVMPTAAIGRLNMRRFARQYARLGVEVNAFGDPLEAYEWLKAQDH